MLVFGGYAGGGAAFADLHLLRVASDPASPTAFSFRWEEVAASGTAPAARFDHSAVAFPTGANSQQANMLAVMGGRDSSSQFTGGCYTHGANAACRWPI